MHMASRIRKGFEARFRELLERMGARRLEDGVRRLLARARRSTREQGLSDADALTRLGDQLAKAARGQRRAARQPGPRRRFYCDSGLGGLARWLRAAGYEAAWTPQIDDTELLRQAGELQATLLTTDSILMERRLLRDGVIPALWLPPTLGIQQQLEAVFREFHLTRGDSRCMSCGGELVRTNKETLRERIPPRTFLWLDEFFVCARCDKLFWHGTHWGKIRQALAHAEAAASIQTQA